MVTTVFEKVSENEGYAVGEFGKYYVADDHAEFIGNETGYLALIGLVLKLTMTIIIIRNVWKHYVSHPYELMRLFLLKKQQQ